MSEISTEHATPRVAESFWGTALRRLRYVLAIAFSAAVFVYVGWQFAAPPADREGVSLMVWGMPMVASLVLALLLIGVAAVCTLLVHPDAPHMGLFCALLGMAALAIRGGTAHLLMYSAQRHGSYSQTAIQLAMECLEWGLLALVGEPVVRIIHNKFFSNTHWITRSGSDLSHQVLQREPGVKSGAHVSVGLSLAISRALRTDQLARVVAAPLAVIASGAIGLLLLSAFLKSQATGQVIFACMISFYLATLCSYMMFPRVPAVAFLVAVPLTAAAGYWWGRNDMSAYPGQGGFFVFQALPIHFVTAGIPGAILGYYQAFNWSVHWEEGE